MPLKCLTSKIFYGSIETDNQGKILKAPKHLAQFLNKQFSELEEVLKKHYIYIDDVEDA